MMDPDGVASDGVEERVAQVAAEIDDVYFVVRGEAQIAREGEQVEIFTLDAQVHVRVLSSPAASPGAEEHGKMDVPTSPERLPQCGNERGGLLGHRVSLPDELR